MDPVEAREKLPELPVSPIDKVAKDSEIWEGSDGGAMFKITRHNISPKVQDFFVMTVSGTPAERYRLVSEFSEILGPPFEYDQSDGADVIETAGWFVNPDL